MAVGGGGAAKGQIRHGRERQDALILGSSGGKGRQWRQVVGETLECYVDSQGLKG